MLELLTVKEASLWASAYLKKTITESNISYLIQYGKIKRFKENKRIRIDKHDLVSYYTLLNGQRELLWKEKLGNDLNWALSFDYLKEKDTTKHVHRLHPYKGKFIPHLVDYFLNDKTDSFKKEVYFKKGDIILDPFSGSGTTMVQANELGMHAVGIDVSAFNTLIANVKVENVDFYTLINALKTITDVLKSFIYKSKNSQFELELYEELNRFNKKYFPSPEFKIKLKNHEVDEKKYSQEKIELFIPIFNRLKEKYQLEIESNHSDHFLEKWYLIPVKKEIDFVFEQLKRVQNPQIKKIITIILSRTIRSCRATTHADLATLKKPVTQVYYCSKHGKICKPLFSIFSWWKRYSQDTIKRFKEFESLKTNTFQICLQGDSRHVDIFQELQKKAPIFGKLAEEQKIKGVFSSPPYLGLIDYHEQHAYAYDLFGFKRNDESEIGPLYKGQGKEAKQSYIEGITQVINNTKKFLQQDYDIFLIANDKHNIYPTIAEYSGNQIVNQYKRPVLNRTEKDKLAYAETIFHLKKK